MYKLSRLLLYNFFFGKNKKKNEDNKQIVKYENKNKNYENTLHITNEEFQKFKNEFHMGITFIESKKNLNINLEFKMLENVPIKLIFIGYGKIQIAKIDLHTYKVSTPIFDISNYKYYGKDGAIKLGILIAQNYLAALKNEDVIFRFK